MAARVVCPGWAGVHTEPIVLREGLEPLSHGMCDDCADAFRAETGQAVVPRAWQAWEQARAWWRVEYEAGFSDAHDCDPAPPFRELDDNEAAAEKATWD